MKPRITILTKGMKLALYPCKDLAWDAGIANTAPCPTEFSIGYNVGSKEEVDSVMELVKIAGAKITKKARETFCAAGWMVTRVVHQPERPRSVVSAS